MLLARYRSYLQSRSGRDASQVLFDLELDPEGSELDQAMRFTFGAMISPGMQPGQIRQNLARQQAAAVRAAQKLAAAYAAQGYSPEAMRALSATASKNSALVAAAIPARAAVLLAAGKERPQAAFAGRCRNRCRLSQSKASVRLKSGRNFCNSRPKNNLARWKKSRRRSAAAVALPVALPALRCRKRNGRPRTDDRRASVRSGH